MVTAYIGIGSNLGDKRNNCFEALGMLGQIPDCELITHSDLYLTKPVGVEDQDWYVNSVASISTSISAQKLLKDLLGIETRMGRIRHNKERWASRIIDLDILVFGKEIIHEKNLIVPHPLMHVRRFVLEPIVDLAPDLIHPSLGLSMAELLQRLPEDGQVVNRIGGQ
jgi:2-amino-4-hydroxy-6-hydroxymethyldihydropteridine diphosphokinase